MSVAHNSLRGFTRRDAIRIGGQGLLGLSLPRLLKAQERDDLPRPAVRAKSVIFLFQWGGPSHLDTFDLKPQASVDVRSKFESISTSVPGVAVCEHLPRTAQVMHHIAQVRSVHHRMNNHNSAGYTALTGMEPPTDDQRLRDSPDLFPAYGSIVDKVAPGEGSMPTFVSFPHRIADGSITPGQHASFLGKSHDPLFIPNDPNAADFRLPQLSLPAGISMDRLRNRRELQRLINAQVSALDASAQARGLDAYYDRALQMLNTPRVRDAFDLSAEPSAIRDAYGRTTYGQSCLLARRLVQAGVKFVTVYFDRSIGGQKTDSGGWDTHGFNKTHMYNILPKRHLPLTDQTLPTLITDLEGRGLLQETLIVWMGEFGRTPRFNKQVSRDHWPRCYTVLLAGGGVRGGAVYGASDKTGAAPDRDPVSVGDLAATMYELLGINPKTEIRDNLNRPLPIAAGRPLRELYS